MKLKELYADYMKNRGPHDFISAYFERQDMKRPTREHIGEGEITQAAKAGGLLMEADIIQWRIYETEGQSVGLSGHAGRAYKCRQWSAEIDADQALIAQGRHPLLSKPTKRK